MFKRVGLLHSSVLFWLAVLTNASPLGVNEAASQQLSRPAFVIVERIATTGDESIQEEYAKLARQILPKYGGQYLARSRQNALIEGEDPVPCCIAILQFPNLDAVRHWYDSPENQSAAKIRQSGARFRIIAVEGLANIQ